MQGLIDSAVFNATLILCSDSPTYLPNNLPISSLNSGTLKSLALALAAKLFPQPGIPTSNTPFGVSTPNFLASSSLLNTCALDLSHSFKPSKPPISSIFSLKSIISNIDDFLIICPFSFIIISLPEIEILFFDSIIILSTWSISSLVNPFNEIATSPISFSSTFILLSLENFKIYFSISSFDIFGISNIEVNFSNSFGTVSVSLTTIIVKL